MSPSLAALRPWFAKSSSKIADAPALVAVRESLPWSLIAFAVALVVFIALMPEAGSFPAGFLRRISSAELPAFGVMGAALAVILSYRLALHLHISRAICVFAALCAFCLALPQPVTLHDPLTYLHTVGESGLFLAILVALVCAYACVAMRSLLGSGAAADAVAAALIVLLSFVLFERHISLALELVTALTPLGRLGDTYVALLVIVLVETLLWLIGVHGPATLAAIVTPVYLTLQLQNTQAFAAHHALPHIVVVSLFLFVFPGGAGATLPLAALLALSKVERLRKIGRVTLVPSLFNINEPLLFGLPIVFNPFLAVPFVITPLLLATISYVAIARGIVARPALYVPAGVPSLASTYLATLDVRAIALVCVNIGIATLLYIPFVRAYERHEARIHA